MANKKVKPKILMIFTRQLATLIDAGLPLLRGLMVLEKQERDPVLKATIGKLSDAVQGGSTFSEGLAQHPKIFNKLYINMVKAGEVGGVLELVLIRLAEFQEKAQKVKNKVVAAMFYPIIVLVIAVAIMGFLLVFIVPKFEQIFKDMLGGKPLPALTEYVIDASRLRAELLVHHRHRRRGAAFRDVPDVLRVGRGQGGTRQDSSCACRSSATSCAKARSRGSAARWARS